MVDADNRPARAAELPVELDVHRRIDSKARRMRIDVSRRHAAVDAVWRPNQQTAALERRRRTRVQDERIENTPGENNRVVYRCSSSRSLN